jgi:hypothetical protein
VFKLSFGRPKDWVDLQAMRDAGVQLDLPYVESQLLAQRGARLYPRLARLRAMFCTD